MLFWLAIFKELTGINCIPHCSENVPGVCITDFEDPNDFSEFKFKLKMTIIVMDIVAVNEIENSITLYVYMMLEWNDSAYSISDPSNTTYLEVPLSNYDEIRRPSLMFLNAFDVQKLSLFGSGKFNYFWIYGVYKERNETSFEYAEYLQVKLGCNFEFTAYPFDKHDCDLKSFCPFPIMSQCYNSKKFICMIDVLFRGPIISKQSSTVQWGLSFFPHVPRDTSQQ